ncbi:hypothetical protein GCM10022252_35700 [Streptosporangium oxazolinicum]|uniref:UspA domain-containing protein n=1 Tax=Streptosporangium oxazolinicum TaxID=909287 RepID=A0ABP8AYC2_9ACTN
MTTRYRPPDIPSVRPENRIRDAVVHADLGGATLVLSGPAGRAGSPSLSLSELIEVPSEVPIEILS